MNSLTRAFFVPALIVLASALFAFSSLQVLADGGGGGPSLGVCGNSIVESFESCDDGNVVDGDGCSSTCTTETGGSESGSGVPAGTWQISGYSAAKCVSNTCPSMVDGVDPLACSTIGETCTHCPVVGGFDTDYYTCQEASTCAPDGTVVGQTQMTYQNAVLQDDDRCCSGSSVYGGQYGRDITCSETGGQFLLPVTAELSVSPSPVAPDAPAILSWNSTNAVSCTGTGFSTGGATSGSVEVRETENTTYAVSCYRSDYTPVTEGFVGNEWWTGTQTKVYSEWVHNNGQQGNLCSDAAAGSPWNVEYREYPNRMGDAGYSLIWLTCYAVNNPTGTVEKPASYNLGTCFSSTDSSCYNLVYFRSANGAAAPTGSWDTASTELVVTAMPDLTVASFSPASASAGVPTVFTGLVWNQGSADTGASFTNTFFLDNDADHATSYYATYPSSRAALSGDMTQVDAVPVTQSITIPSPGTWYMRFCTDMNASWTGTITESNEANNCSDALWTAVTVNSVTPTAALSCSPASCTAPTGTPVTLTYACTNSTSATLSTFGSLSPVSGGTKDATVAGGYTLSCTGPGGTVNDIETVSFTVPTVDITATPDRVRQGGTTNVSWTASADVTDCTITRAGAAFATGASGTNVPATNITTQTTFAASCTSGGIPGAASDTVIVNIVPNFEEF